MKRVFPDTNSPCFHSSGECEDQRETLRGGVEATHPLPQVVGEEQISGEVVGEGRVELQHLLQGVALDDVQVAVGESAHVGAGLSQSHLLPEDVAKHVSLA